jgi:hypothetical protein
MDGGEREKQMGTKGLKKMEEKRKTGTKWRRKIC